MFAETELKAMVSFPSGRSRVFCAVVELTGTRMVSRKTKINETT